MNQPFMEHVRELRRRLMVAAGVMLIGAGAGYVVRNPILAWLQAPLHGTLYYSQVLGAFNFLMQACLLVGLLPTIPVLVYNLIAFIQPALPRPVSKGQVIGMVAASSMLAAGGAAFAYYVSLPVVLHFLSHIAVSHLHPLIAADSYLNFVMNYLGVFALIFQLPLVLLFIDRIKPIPPASLKRFRKWVIAGAFGAALILPIAPDPVSQTMLALPVVVLYELSLWLVVLAHRHRAHAAQLVPAHSLETVIPQSRPERAQTAEPVRPRSARPPLAIDGFRFRPPGPPVIDLRQRPS